MDYGLSCTDETINNFKVLRNYFYQGSKSINYKELFRKNDEIVNGPKKIFQFTKADLQPDMLFRDLEELLLTKYTNSFVYIAEKKES